MFSWRLAVAVLIAMGSSVAVNLFLLPPGLSGGQRMLMSAAVGVVMGAAAGLTAAFYDETRR